ncbi:uncharacterized protein C8A04DRAFT_35521 [Dichotomopilus funicola]|uniref:Uncharacterized protein n=1 Tax=Dichotomopilus funicola TaxID=1934379 RepID=A0AAN6V7B2_9PEZI|nr:hypothetical protein C8A04DRAFT_35521 [Dichotomopilus funicola]
MFGARRHRPPNPPLTAATANPNAATAAAAVFKRHESNPTLSAAAAAAALRARPTTPTRVADVQTKRTVRRSSSVASTGTASEQGGRDRAGGLQRRGSNGSMTERTAPSIGGGGAPIRLASQKLALGDLGSVRRTDPAMASPPSSPLPVIPREDDGQVVGEARPSSQASSINFSYPTRARRGSADFHSVAELNQGNDGTRHTTSALPGEGHSSTVAVKQPPSQQALASPRRAQSISVAPDQTLVYDPNSRRMKKKRAPQRAGSHLAARSLGRTKSLSSYTPSATNETRPQSQPQPVARQANPATPKPTANSNTEAQTAAATSLAGASPKSERRHADSHPVRAPVEPLRAVAPSSHLLVPGPSSSSQSVVRRQPSVIQEGSEPEDIEDRKPTPALAPAASAAAASTNTHVPATPPQSSAGPSARSSATPTTQQPAQRLNVAPVDVPGSGRPGTATTAPEHGRAADISRERTHSSSPARQAHFGPVLDNPMIKHSPPPRPSRGVSPAGTTSEASGSKSVRVSFEDNNSEEPRNDVSLATNQRATSPATATNPLQSNRHSWLANLGHSQAVPAFDDDTVMKPRPALPSFGSVRDRKPRDNAPTEAERPLVRPKGESKYPSTSPLLPSPTLGGPSSGHAVGGSVLENVHHHSERAQQTTTGLPVDNSSYDNQQREPLPPIVTSVEGTGYISDDSSDASSLLSSEWDQSHTSLPALVAEAYSAPAPPAHADTTAQELQIPGISVQKPTPVDADTEDREEYFVDVPGGFPEDGSDESTVLTPNVPREAAPAVQAVEAPAVAQAPQAAAAETSSDSDNDVFSDAYEDLSDVEGDGFQSLDAAVDSPVQQSPPRPRPGVPAEQISPEPRRRQTMPGVVPQLLPDLSSATTAVEDQPSLAPEDDWEKAKAFWKSLTAEKRAQLAQEAREEAGIDADKDEAQPELKQQPQKKKKTVERRNSERKALAARVAQQQAAVRNAQQGQQETAVHRPDRTYMIIPGERWAGEDDELALPRMRTTMRGATSQPQDPASLSSGSRLRKSMRANGSGPSSNSHQPQRPDSQAAVQRPGSSSVAMAPTNFGPRTNSASQLDAGVQPVPLGRRGSTGSESSFRRTRTRPTKQGSLGAGFRQSMRPMSSSSVPQGEHFSSNKRFSLRALSPTGSASPPSGVQMRATLRETSAAKRNSTGGIRMPSFSLGKKSGSKTAASGGGRRTNSRLSSRLADSSDEEGGGGGTGSGFQSRFEDSSDDEPVVVPIPAASLPKSKSGGTVPSAPVQQQHHLRKETSLASTALSEELEEEEEESDEPAAGVVAGPSSPKTNTKNSPQSPAALNTTTLHRTRSGRGQLASPIPSTPPSASKTKNNKTSPEARTSRRNSLLSVLRHRKKDSGSNKIGRADISESAARRDTKLERTVGQLEAIRSRSRGGDAEVEAEVEGEEDEAGQEVTTPSSPSGRGLRLQKPSRTAPAIISLARHDSGPTPTTTTTTSLPFAPSQICRSSTSRNLGTRTLSGGGGGASNGGFMSHFHRHHHDLDHPSYSPPSPQLRSPQPPQPQSSAQSLLQQQQQRRVSSMGFDVASVDGSAAGASSTTRKKRFSGLRKILGIHD